MNEAEVKTALALRLAIKKLRTALLKHLCKNTSGSYQDEDPILDTSCDKCRPSIKLLEETAHLED